MVRMTKVMSKPLLQHLEVKYRITSAILSSMSLDELFAVISSETQVYSETQFYKELSDALQHVRIMEWKYVTPVNHEVFYFQQLKLIHEMKKLLKIMLVRNKEYCPKVNFKPCGLLKLFVEVNDKTYVNHCLPAIATLRFATFEDFCEEYLEIILSHYQLSLRSREMPYTSNLRHEEKQREYYDRNKVSVHRS
jgi:hypothetical protein